MGSKRREFKKKIQFQNYKSDGAILNLAAHDPIDWPNIISIWKGLIVQKYIQTRELLRERSETDAKNSNSKVKFKIHELLFIVLFKFSGYYSHYYSNLAATAYGRRGEERRGSFHFFYRGVPS
jgi:hypothetical protein